MVHLVMSFTNCLIHNPRQLPDANIYSIINCERHSENVDSVPTVVLNQDSLHSSYSSLIFLLSIFSSLKMLPEALLKVMSGSKITWKIELKYNLKFRPD